MCTVVIGGGEVGSSCKAQLSRKGERNKGVAMTQAGSDRVRRTDGGGMHNRIKVVRM